MDFSMSKNCLPITEVEVEFIQISCRNSSSTNAPKIVVDSLGFIQLKESVKKRLEALKDINQTLLDNSTKDKSELTDQGKGAGRRGRSVNVVIFGVDAVSHMNFIRTMPVTYEYLTKNLSGLSLWGYTKVGDNTFPNVVPALTGLFVEELNTTGRCWKSKKDVFDKCPFIWKDYANQGYVTAYGEDAVWMTSFNYQKNGFSVQPTDYYHNTLKKIGHAHMINANICFGPRLSFQVLLDYCRKMATTMKSNSSKYFQFIWANALTHDYLNQGKIGDRILLETFNWFKDEGHLEDTVFVLMSDHGIRWGGIWDTLQGKVEERMPFLYFVFPQWFREEYRSAVSNLQANKHRLTTPFDLHKTLKDLLFLNNIKADKIRERHLNLVEISNSNENLPRGISLFLPIPFKRSCVDAGIVEQWCVCRAIQPALLENNSLVTEAARSVVYFINGMFVKFPQCLMLQFKQILNAQVLQLDNKKVVDASATITNSSDPRLNKQPVTFSLAVLVEPSNATFEAKVTRHTNGDWIVSRDISRTNVYGEQSRCVTDYNLKKFCYCG